MLLLTYRLRLLPPYSPILYRDKEETLRALGSNNRRSILGSECGILFILFFATFDDPC